MQKIVVNRRKDGYWVAECSSYPGFVSGGNTKREARANFREAISGILSALEKMESDPKFVEMMERSEADIRAGRVHTQEEVERMVRRRQKRRLWILN